MIMAPLRESSPGVIDQFSIRSASGIWTPTALSNMLIEPDGTAVERDFQANKCADPDEAAAILACPDPKKTKAMGQKVKLRPDWELIKFQVMVELQFRKFLDHPILMAELMSTGSCLLIEGNVWHDNVWGDCRCGDPQRPECARPGLNWLGQIHMCVREGLAQI